MSGFHFFPVTILKNCLGSRDTPRDIKVKKFFFKNLKRLKVFSLRKVIHDVSILYEMRYSEIL